MTKKVLALLLVLVFSAGFFAACTPETPGSTDTNSVFASSSTDTEKTDISVNQNTSSQINTSESMSSQTNTNDEGSSEVVNSDEIPEFEKIIQGDYVEKTEAFEYDLLRVGIMPSLYHKEYTVEDFSEVGCVEILRCDEYSIRYPETQVKYPTKCYTIRLDNPSKEKTRQALRTLEKRTDIRTVELITPVVTDSIPTVDLYPTDFYYVEGMQWGIDRARFTSAWDITTGAVGSNRIRVGIIDTGINLSHDDLNDGQVNTTLSKNYNLMFDTPFEDVSGHGTAVASIIGATAYNDGMVGTCWNIELIIFRCGTGEYSNGTETLDYYDIVDAVQDAEEMGVDILNCSFSGMGDHDTLKAAMQDFSGLIVCTAGNRNTNCDNIDYYPVGFQLPNMISVGASTINNGKWGNSSYGQNTIDLFAPGEDILVCSGTSNYVNMSGTSFAAPHVVGAAALVLSVNSSLSPQQVKSCIVDNVDKFDVFTTRCISGGRLNAYKAVQAAHPHAFSTISSDEYTHQRSCSCGLQVSESHSFYYDPLSQSHHAVYCVCGYSGTEVHEYEEYDEFSMCCSKCGTLIDLMSVEPDHEVE